MKYFFSDGLTRVTAANPFALSAVLVSSYCLCALLFIIGSRTVSSENFL
jgi:hypothetical protein